MVKNPPASQETWVPSLRQKDLLEKGMATHITPWQSPRTQEPRGLQAMESQRGRHTSVTMHSVCVCVCVCLCVYCFPGGSEVKASASNAGDPSSIPGLGRSPEKEMVTHSSILSWGIPWTEEPVGLQSTGSQRVGHDWARYLTYLIYIHTNNFVSIHLLLDICFVKILFSFPFCIYSEV